jgi:DNA-binding NarL/FixJ family response regulator
VAAASEIVRAGLEALLAAQPAFTVRGLVADAAALPALAAGGHPAAIVVLADEPHGAWVVDALRAGVRAILPRQATAVEIVAAVEAAAGLVALHPDAVDALIPAAAAARTLPGPPPHQALTPREIEVLSMMAEGLGNKEIAWRLGLSEHTVKFHVSAIFAKLNAASRTEAVTLGIRQGLIAI